VPWGWVGVAFFLALAAGAAAFGFASGLPPDTSISLPWPPLHWSPANTGAWVASITVFLVAFAVTWLIFAIVAAVWRGLGFVAALILPLLGFPQVPNMERGIQAALAFIFAAALASTVFKNPLAILALSIAFLALAAAICVRHAVTQADERGFGMSARSSAIGGGQTEWRISPALAFSLLALALAGGAVTLGASALRPASPASAPAPPPPGGAKDKSKSEPSPPEERGEPKAKTPAASPDTN